MTEQIWGEKQINELPDSVIGRIVVNKADTGDSYRPVTQDDVDRAKRQLGSDDNEFSNLNNKYYRGLDPAVVQVNTTPSEGVILGHHASYDDAMTTAVNQDLSRKTNPNDITQSNHERTMMAINTNPLAADVGGDLTSYAQLKAKELSMSKLHVASDNIDRGRDLPDRMERGEGKHGLDFKQASKKLGLKTEFLGKSRVENAEAMRKKVFEVETQIDNVRGILLRYLNTSIEVKGEGGEKARLFVPPVTEDGTIEPRVLAKLVADLENAPIKPDVKVDLYRHIRDRLQQIADAKALPALKFVNNFVHHLENHSSSSLEQKVEEISGELNLQLVTSRISPKEALLASQILGLDPMIVFRSTESKESVARKAREAGVSVSQYLANNYIN